MYAPIRRICGVLGLAALAVTFLAQTPAAARKGTTSLWKVSSPSTTVYLLGSIHLLKEDDYPLSERMIEAYQDAEELVFEVHPDSLESPTLQGYILQNAMYPEGETLMSDLGETDYNEASSLAEDLEINLGLFSTFKPWFASMVLAITEMQKLGFSPELGVEMHFAEMARTDGKPMTGIETAKYQMDLFIGLPEDLQKDMLFYTLRQMADIESELAAIVEAWKTGDLPGLEKTLNKSLKDFPEIFDTLIVNRNLNWIEDIDKYLKDGKTRIVIVGVGHMPGDKGLIKLLKGRGYKVEQY